MDPNDANSASSQPTDASQDEKTVPEMPVVPAAGQDRRTFLKAAVVASAAVAAAGGAAGAALISGGQPKPLVRFIGNANSGDPCDACIEGTLPNPTTRPYLTTNTPATSTQLAALQAESAGFTINSQGHAAGDFEIFFVDHAPAAAPSPGKINLTVQITGSTSTTTLNKTDIDDPSQTVFAYSGGGQAVLITEQSNVTTVNGSSCPTTTSTSMGTYLATLNTDQSSLKNAGMGSAGGFAYNPLNTGDDVLVQFHLTWNGGRLFPSPTTGEQLFTFLFTWTDTGTGGASCTKYLYIYGQQN